MNENRIKGDKRKVKHEEEGSGTCKETVLMEEGK